jgi:hypothetical protein
MMDYTDLVKEIEQQGLTKLPALFIVIAKECIKRKVFANGGMLKVFLKVLSENGTTINNRNAFGICDKCGYEQLACLHCGKSFYKINPTPKAKK